MEALISSTLDVALAAALTGLAWGALNSTDLFKAIILFIAFGLAMALAWVRLDAPDIALAEAAIGAGVTGALLLSAYAKMRAFVPHAEIDDARYRRGPRAAAVSTLIVSLAIALAYGTRTLVPADIGLGKTVAANIEQSGVGNPVTAVLLNFRGYDTLLEVMVLLLALIGAWSFGTGSAQPEPGPGLVLDSLARSLAPLVILVAMYLLWAGAEAPGGAFQAGAVLAAAGVLTSLAGWRLPAALAGLPLRLVLVFGPATFLLIAVIALQLDGVLLQFSPESAGHLILIIETSAALSIGITLVALFLGAPPEVEDRQ